MGHFMTKIESNAVGVNDTAQVNDTVNGGGISGVIIGIILCCIVLDIIVYIINGKQKRKRNEGGGNNYATSLPAAIDETHRNLELQQVVTNK